MTTANQSIDEIMEQLRRLRVAVVLSHLLDDVSLLNEEVEKE